MYGQCVGQSKKQQQKLTRQQLELQLAEEEDEEEEEAEALLTVRKTGDLIQEFCTISGALLTACCADYNRFIIRWVIQIRHSIA